ncbi:MAG: HAD-IA family hydrolase [Bacilli bacterium]|nr:HAD-IA family hydrolase [Acholeplasmataceae bacterium]MDY2902713.1 HAD-IA family hydrolase [Bacilli bacterium]
MVKLVIFDLDGTLLNTLDDISISVNYALNKNNLNTVTKDEIKYMIGNGVDLLIKRAIKDNLEKFNDVKCDYLKYYHENCEVNTRPYDGIIEELIKLKKDHIKIAVFSNKPDNDTNKMIAKYFPNTFDVVLGKKDCNRIKPYPDGVLEIKKKLDIQTNGIFIGDSDVDIETGKNAHMKTIGVLWGFRNEQYLKEADAIIAEPNELYKIIKEL